MTRKICSRNTAGLQLQRQSLQGSLSVNPLQSSATLRQVAEQQLCRHQRRTFRAVMEPQYSQTRLSARYPKSEALWAKVLLTRRREQHLLPRGRCLPEVFLRNLHPTLSQPHRNTLKLMRDHGGMIESLMCCWEKTKRCRELVWL